MHYSTAKLRRAYFACCKSLGMGEDERHLFNESRVGKTSTRDFNRDDWGLAVSLLQQMGGMRGVSEGRPRLKAERAATVLSGGFATDRQIQTIEDLCDQVAWTAGRDKGPPAYVAKHLLAAPEYILVRDRIAREGWKALPRDLAVKLIVALQRMANAYPTEAGHEC